MLDISEAVAEQRAVLEPMRIKFSDFRLVILKIPIDVIRDLLPELSQSESPVVTEDPHVNNEIEFIHLIPFSVSHPNQLFLEVQSLFKFISPPS